MVREVLETLRQSRENRELISHLGALEFIRYQLTVDYGARLENLVTAGEYDHISEPQIAGNRFLRSTKRGQEILSIAQIQFGREMFSHNASELILSSGLRLPGIVELLYWGLQYPEQQRHSPIVALGATTRVGRTSFLVFLDGDTESRDLLIIPHGLVWPACTRFLAICPPPS